MTLVYFAPVAWDGYPQRPHYFVRHFLRWTGGKVVWIDPYPSRLPVVRDLQRLTKDRGARLTLERPAGLTVVSLRALPIDPLPVGRWLNRELLWRALSGRLSAVLGDDVVAIGVGRPSGLALAALRALGQGASFYDAMDDFPEFYRGISKRSVSANEREIAGAVDLILTSSSALWDKFEWRGSRRIMVRNGFEMSDLPPLPIERDGRQVFGYVGCIGAWFDWTAVVRLAESFPDAAVHLVGPCFAGPPRRLPSNVAVFPACPVDRAIAYFRTFSVGLIPFKRTRLTDGVDPIKYYAYRGMGLPVLSTMFGEMTRRGSVDGTFFLDRNGGLKNAASAALAAKADTSSVEQFRREHTWERRFEEARVFERVLESA